MTIYESNQYCIEEDHGGLRIAKLTNGQKVADVFLQPGDDSAKLRQQLETLDTSNERQAQAFDHALSEYESVMTMPDGRYYQRESVAEDLSPNVSGVGSFKEMKSQTNIEIYLDYAGIDPLFLDADPVAVRVRSDFKRTADQEIQTGQVAFALEDQPDRFIDAVSLRHRALDTWDRSMASESPDVTGPMIGEIGGAAPEVAQELGTIASDQPLAPAVPAKQPETELARTPEQESAGEIAVDIDKIAENAKVQEQEPGSLYPATQAKQEKEQDAVGYMPPKPKREPIGDLRPGALAPKEQANAYAPVKFYNDKNKHVMTDEGYRLNVRARASIDEKVLLAAIKEGQERFGEPVRIAGNPLFMARMAQVSVKNGIEINPDGPFKGIAEQIIEKSRGQEAGMNVIGGDAPEVMQFGKGKLNARVLGVAENGDVLIKQNGREKVLDAPLNKDHREQLRTMIGKPVEIQIAQDGVVQISAGPDMSVGHQQSRQSPGLAV
ncbi:hypothetical protein JKG47_09400 [Acidithiobacillus sp. MC6.1]|nr:hypothetical protein [Acidithiobacillus sp. MC6.1]